MKKILLRSLIFVVIIAMVVSIAVFARDNKIDNVYASTLATDVQTSWYDAKEYNDYAGNLQAINNMISGMSNDQKSNFKDNPIVVVVLDTGANLDHELFDGVLFKNPLEANGTAGVDDDNDGYIDDIIGWDFVGDDNDVTDECSSSTLDGHGSHVAGIVATEIRKYGLQDYIKILPVRAGDKSGSFSTMRVSNALTYILKLKSAYEKNTGKEMTMVINMSLKNRLKSWQKDGTVDKKIQQAVKAGAILVAAAGNEGDSSENGNYYIGSPAALDNVIGVMAYGASNNSIRNYNYGNAYDIAAPGYKIISATRVSDDDYTSKNGTSMATPIVSFMAAVLSIHFERDTAMVYEAITKTSIEATGTVDIIKNPDGKGGGNVVYTAKKANLQAFLEYKSIKKVEVVLTEGNSIMHINSSTPLSFKAVLYKYGSDEPLPDSASEYQNVTMYIVRTNDKGEVIDDDAAETFNCSSLTYTPSKPGNYGVYAQTSAYSLSGSNVYNFTVKYAEVKDADLKVDCDEWKYNVGEWYTFYIDNYYKVDPDYLVTWSVYDENDSFVEMATGDMYLFMPKESGTYTITCKIGNNTISETTIKVQIEKNKIRLIVGVSIASACVVAFIITLVIVKKFKKRRAI